jgi:murein DD-endopeptidase MepM/ murein hydrolase activator NlpD
MLSSFYMDNKPLHDFPPETGVSRGETAEQKPNLITKWMERLAHLGLGELSMRIGTNIVIVILVVIVVLLLESGNLGGGTVVSAASNQTPQPTQQIGIHLPAEVAISLDGISRQAQLHTIIPSRPRIDVITYTVQSGDSIFKIADTFGLKPTTILFGNYETLKDSPDLLDPGQSLNILPVDGTYYQWVGTESLTAVASTFGVDPETIIDYPGNHLDPDTIGDLSHPNIAAGTWLIVPGGSRQFTSWTAPATLVREDPSVRVWGPGVCTGITTVQVGYGTFVFPTVEHWLSGTDYRPDLNHYGVDFAGSMGNAIYAVDAGTVVYAGWNTWGYGNMIMLDHGNGWQSLYGHLSQINVQCGQSVGQGDIIGLMGSTGHSTGPHLHFELSYNGAHINPHVIYNITSP